MVPYIQIPIESSKKELMQKNVSKYIFFAWTLEWLAIHYFYKDIKDVNLRFIEENIYKSKLLSKKEASPNDISHWLQEMQAMGLIKLVKIVNTDESEINMTEFGYEAYRSQTYNSLATNLMEAQASRKIAKTAVWISVISIIIAIILGILNFI